MPRDYLVLLLPVAWALIATAIGIVLYKSSEAFFENSSVIKGRRRTLRLTGAVVIAALAFYGIRMSTPVENLLANNPGVVRVPMSELQLAKGKVDEQINDLILFSSCLELDQAGGTCRDQLVALKNRARELQQVIDAMNNNR